MKMPAADKSMGNAGLASPRDLVRGESVAATGPRFRIGIFFWLG